MELSRDQLEIRRPLWIALSELYLDTEPDWERVGSICAASPFDVLELRRILFDEVHPVVYLNLWSATGVWEGFDEDWLVASILARKRRPLFRLPWPEERRSPWRELKPHFISARQTMASSFQQHG